MPELFQHIARSDFQLFATFLLHLTFVVLFVQSFCADFTTTTIVSWEFFTRHMCLPACRYLTSRDTHLASALFGFSSSNIQQQSPNGTHGNLWTRSWHTTRRVEHECSHSLVVYSAILFSHSHCAARAMSVSSFASECTNNSSFTGSVHDSSSTESTQSGVLGPFSRHPKKCPKRSHSERCFADIPRTLGQTGGNRLGPESAVLGTRCFYWGIGGNLSAEHLISVKFVFYAGSRPPFKPERLFQYSTNLSTMRTDTHLYGL